MPLGAWSLWPESDSMSTPSDFTSTGMCPTACTASVWNSAPRAFAIFASSAIGSIVLLMAYCLIRAYCVAYVRAFAPSRRWLGGFPSSLDIRAVALGAMFRRATRVAVITEKPFGFESRWLHQLAALCLGNRIWFLHAGMDLSEVACHYRKAHVVVVGPFSDSKPSWVDRLCAPSGEVLRAHDRVHEVLPGAVLPPHPAYTD